jgi:two-component system OmpR family sensor kinase
VTSPRAWLRRWSTWSLRTRLLVTTTVMLALVSAVIVLVTTVVLRAQLNANLTDKLEQARSAPFMQQGAALVNFPQISPAKAVAVVVTDGQVTDSGRTSSENTGAFNPRSAPPTLTQAQQQALLAVPDDGRDHSVSVPGLGDYLVTVAHDHEPNGGGSGRYAVIGLSEQETQSITSQLVLTETVVAVLGVILTGFLSVAVIRISLRPLDRVAATAVRISRLPLDKGEVGELARVPEADTDARTEAGQVGASLNRMIDHVSAALAARHASETRVRQFVADASHELRTPLASIRGYAELTRRGKEVVPPDTAYALGRIESEAGRMTGMVEDLLLLARLDAGRPLEREPLDLSPLVVDAVRDAHAAGPGHRWQVDVPDDPVIVQGDEHRLHQILVNLLANAGKHTPEGTAVTARVRNRADGRREITVADNGPGIPESLLPVVFERFARGDGSRSRAAGSTGLGLAIVSAVVQAHGGQVSVASSTQAPSGTTFTVLLPGG